MQNNPSAIDVSDSRWYFRRRSDTLEMLPSTNTTTSQQHMHKHSSIRWAIKRAQYTGSGHFPPTKNISMLYAYNRITGKNAARQALSNYMDELAATSLFFICVSSFLFSVPLCSVWSCTLLVACALPSVHLAAVWIGKQWAVSCEYMRLLLMQCHWVFECMVRIDTEYVRAHAMPWRAIRILNCFKRFSWTIKRMQRRI